MFLRCSQNPGALLAHFECQNIHSLKNIGGATYCMSIVFPRVHPIVLLKRASRSLTKTGFFWCSWHYVFHYFGVPRRRQDSSMLDLCWSSSWEASWRRLGAILGGFWEAKTAPRRPQNAPRRPQDAPRRDHDGPRWLQDAPKMLPRRAQDAFKTEAEARCASEA